MNLQVDQSIKMENTSSATVLALSNDESYAVLVPATVKRQCVQRLRQRGRRGKTVTLLVFSACVFLLLEGHLHRLTQVTVDTEYPGHDDDVRGTLLGLIRRRRPDFERADIVFRPIGKRARAHKRAIAVARGNATPDLVLTTGRILRLLLG